MFQGVRQGSVLYILKKGETPTLDAAHVVSVSNPYNPNAQNIFGQNPMVDIQVSIDGEAVTFKELPALVSFTTSKDGVFVTDNTEDMLAEVKNLHRRSQQIVESAPYHEQLLALYESFYDILDPNLAKEKEKDKRLNLLEEEVKGMKGTITDIHKLLLTSLKSGNQPLNKE